MTLASSRIVAGVLLAIVAVALWADPAAAICGRKSCVVGSTPTYSGGGGGGGSYDPFRGMGGMVDMMMGVMGAMEAQQQQMTAQQARELYQRGEALSIDGQYVAAVAAYQQALRLMPGDATIQAALQRAQQSLDQLRQQEAARQSAEKAALQKRIAGIIGGLSGGFDGAGNPPAASALDGVDFAPAGTSFFGTGGGPGGAAPPAARAKAPPPPRPASGAPSYSTATPPARETQGLDFVGAKDPLFDKGHQGSAAPDLRDSVAGGRSRDPKASALPQKLDFSTSTAQAQPTQMASTPPDLPRQSGVAPWARTFVAGALVAAAAATSGLKDVSNSVLISEPPALGTQTAAVRPEPRVYFPKDHLPPELAPKHPMSIDSALDLRERRAREIANDAFDRMGTGQFDNAVRLLEVAHEQAPSNASIARALAEAKDIRGKMPPQKELWERMEFERQNGVEPRLFPAGRYGADGYDALNQGRYRAAIDQFTDAGASDPQWKEWTLRQNQARIGYLLSGEK